MVLGILVAGLPALVPSKVLAFQVQPAIIELAVGAGSSTQRTMVVRNTDPTPSAYVLTVQKFQPGGDGRPAFLDPADVSGLPSWLRVSDPTFSLEPGTEKRITVDIAVPASAEPGGAYAAVFVTEKPAAAGPLGIARRIATLFLVSVGNASGDVRIAGVTQSVGASDGDALGIRAGGETAVSLRNRGHAHDTVEARVHVETHGIFGKHIYEETRAARLLPDEERTVSVPWSGASPIGFVRASVVLSNGQAFRTARDWYALPVPSVLLAALCVGLSGIAFRAIRRYRKSAVG